MMKAALRASVAIGMAFPAMLLAVGPATGLSAAETGTATLNLPPLPANGELGFVVTGINGVGTGGARRTPDDCPDGFAGNLRSNYLASLSASERERLNRKENDNELRAKTAAYAVGPDNANICSNPELFDRPAQATYKGRFGQGFNLDNDQAGTGSDGYTCAHQNLVTPAGETGIDNQVLRVQGCRGGGGGGGGQAAATANSGAASGAANPASAPAPARAAQSPTVGTGMAQFLISGEWTQLFLIRGLDSWVKDDDVEIIYANTEDRALVDSQKNFLLNASYSITANPKYRNVLHGRMANGVLTTDPVHIHLRQTWGQGQSRGDIRGTRTEYDLDRARLRMTFQADGSLRVMMGGYQPLWDIIQVFSLGGVGSATAQGMDCAAEYWALVKLADGGRDPKTGKCTTISNAYTTIAIPAYVFDRPAPRKIVRK